MKSLRLTIVFLLILIGVIPAASYAQSNTYPETRKLLLKMERGNDNKILKKLFEEGQARKSDFIQALNDSDQKVSLNAQSIIKYLADPPSLAALEEWYNYRRKNADDYWISPVQLMAEVKYLDGEGRDLGTLVLQNLYPETEEVRAKQVAFNRDNKTVLVEVIIGHTFTEGWQVVIRQEGGKWRVLSQYLVWQS